MATPQLSARKHRATAEAHADEPSEAPVGAGLSSVQGDGGFRGTLRSPSLCVSGLPQ